MRLDVVQPRDSNSRTLFEVQVLKQRISYTADSMPEYVGLAIPGTNTTATGWQIKKITYSGTNATQIDWADGDSKFDNTWSDRATLGYW